MGQAKSNTKGGCCGTEYRHECCVSEERCIKLTQREGVVGQNTGMSVV